MDPHDRLLVASLAVFVTACSILGFGRTDASNDEAYTSAEAHLGWGDLVSVLWNRELNASLHTVLIWVLARLGLDALWLTRAISLCLGLLALLLCYLLLRTALPQDRLSRPIIAVALAGVFVNPLIVEDLLNARTYTLTLAMASASTLLLVRQVQTSSSRTRSWFAWGLLNGAMLYGHFWTGPVILAQWLWLALLHADRIRKWGHGAVTTAALALPVVGFFLAGGGQADQVPDSPPRNLLMYFVGLLQVVSGGANSIRIGQFLLVFVVIFLAGVGATTVGLRRWTALGLASVTVPYALAALAAHQQPALFYPNYLIFGLPGLALVLACGLIALRSTWLTWTLMIGFIAASVWEAGQLASMSASEQRPLTTAAAMIRSHARAGDHVTSLAPFESFNVRRAMAGTGVATDPPPQDAEDFLAASSYRSSPCPGVTAPRLWVFSFISKHVEDDLAAYAECGGYRISDISTYDGWTVAQLVAQPPSEF